MRDVHGPAGPTCWVLDEDPGLVRHVAEGEIEAARRSASARIVEIGVGVWRPDAVLTSAGGSPEDPPDPAALLVLRGAVVRSLSARGAAGSVLVGQGELIWGGSRDVGATIARSPRWTALTDLRLAVIDNAFLERVAPWPQITLALLRRAARQAEMVALEQAIACHVRVEDRLLMLMLALAERWGRIERDSVHLDLPLTVTVLAELVAAQRQTVSATIARLGRDGKVVRGRRGWSVSIGAVERFATGRGASELPA